ncbi:MATE family efflux transporter [Candidatus Sumerlaeota bacterium]|nr:MATE family efflux transporter [Candidatus Sumerlaeota bacterium]
MINHKSGSYGEIFSIALPLVVSTSSWTLMHFTDRLFLSRYSNDALAAALPAGVTSFTFICFFMGVAGYTSAFVAQYYGSGQFKKIGPIVWQGIFFALFSGILLLPLIPLSFPLFRFIGHPGKIPELEAAYFQILCYGKVFALLSGVFSGFFSGLGKTKTVMTINILGASLNVVLDYAWIFGMWRIPRWGIYGAAWATIISTFLMALAFFILFIMPENRKKYAAISGFGFDFKLFRRLLRYGIPNGVQFLLDMAAFTLFVLFIGRLGKVELQASNIAFNINVFAFMPMIGFGIAASILVGQYLGRNMPHIAEICVKRIFRLTFLYMAIISMTYILFPSLYVRIYGSRENPELLEDVYRMAKILLVYVAVYSFFDSVNLIFSSAIKGAGDTDYVMKIVVIASIFCVIIPSYVCCVIYNGSVYIAWTFFSLYIVVIAIAFLLRYRGGKWKSMRVIEMRISELTPAASAPSESEVMR